VVVSAPSRAFFVPWAGIAAGPAAWAVNTQANLAAVPWVCAHKVNFIPVVAVALAGVALAGAFLSWRAWGATEGARAAETPRRAQPAALLAGIGLMTGVLFALVILTQGAAALVLTGCER
jgi:hypothetical protein